jgi:hypothetical protein
MQYVELRDFRLIVAQLLVIKPPGKHKKLIKQKASCVLTSINHVVVLP